MVNQAILNATILKPQGWKKICNKMENWGIQFTYKEQFLPEHKIFVVALSKIAERIYWIIFPLPITVLGILLESWNWTSPFILFVITSIINGFIRAIFTSTAENPVNQTYVYSPGNLETADEKYISPELKENLDFRYKKALLRANTYFQFMAILTHILPFAILMFLHPEHFRISLSSWNWHPDFRNQSLVPFCALFANES